MPKIFPSFPRLPERDDRDLGWYWWRGAGVAHWIRTSEHSGLAVSHCGLVTRKEVITDANTWKRCYYCQLIEDQRPEKE